MILSWPKRVVSLLKQKRAAHKLCQVYGIFSDYTMVPPDEYVRNLQLCQKAQDVEGAIVECGVWRGGMIAGMAKILGKNRNYYLFDSFEGLPPAQDVDGDAAKNWQSDTASAYYFDNCKAEIEFAQKAMSLALNGQIERVKFVKGWFNEKMSKSNFDEPIAILRLDGDWYESTMVCLEFLFPYVRENGLVIIDDYHMWDGCSRAVHDYLSKHQRTERIYQYENRTAYIIKKP